MASKLDMGLEDIIKTSKKVKKGGRGGGTRGAGRGGNMARGGRGGRGGIKRLNSQSPLKSRGMNGKWQHDKANGVALRSPPSGPAKLSVANLDFGVNDQDINELFSRCGHIVKACVHYDSSGRSQGTAEVVYRSHKEAASAVTEYNGRLLDGRAMNVQIVGGTAKPTNLASRIGGPPIGRGANRARRGGRTGAVAGSGQRGRGGAARGRGRGRGGRSAGPPVTREDLDKQMDDYRMQVETA